jgi:hypothetical protein
MKFFVPPHTKDDEQSEEVYEAIAKFVGGAVTNKRIWRLKWRHNGMDMEAEVDKPLPHYYQTGQEPVLAIIDCGNWYSVCTPNKGGYKGEPVMAGKGHDTHVTYFDKEAS